MDSITWLRDGSEVRGESIVFSQTQILSDTSSATYQHILSSEDISSLVGSFTCQVEDVSGNLVERTLALNGINNVDSLSITNNNLFYITKMQLLAMVAPSRLVVVLHRGVSVVLVWLTGLSGGLVKELCWLVGCHYHTLSWY